MLAFLGWIELSQLGVMEEDRGQCVLYESTEGPFKEIKPKLNYKLIFLKHQNELHSS